MDFENNFAFPKVIKTNPVSAKILFCFCNFHFWETTWALVSSVSCREDTARKCHYPAVDMHGNHDVRPIVSLHSLSAGQGSEPSREVLPTKCCPRSARLAKCGSSMSGNTGNGLHFEEAGEVDFVNP